MNAWEPTKRLKVAVIGGGPGGLGAAIELSRLSFVDWNLYEKNPQFRETGGGITLQPHTWRLLERNGTAVNIESNDFFRPAAGLIEQRRNARNGKLLHEKRGFANVPLHHQTCRLARPRLQAALLKNVDHTRVHVGRKIIGVEQLADNRVEIKFADGFVDKVDLLVAADGIRSFIRNICFPDHVLCYNGQSVYRTIISKTKAARIRGLPWAPVFWKHVSGLYVYTCPLGDDEFEVTARIRRPNVGKHQVSWGRPFDLHTLLHEYTDFCPPVQQVLQLAAAGATQEFALLSGPRLQSMAYHGNIAFVGDAAHALCGNFGAGAGFALEDAYTLARSLEWAFPAKPSLRSALDLYDSIRSPHYKRLYGVLDKFVKIKTDLGTEGLPVDDEIKKRVQRIAQATEDWMYYYEIDRVVEAAISKHDTFIGDIQTGGDSVPSPGGSF